MSRDSGHFPERNRTGIEVRERGKAPASRKEIPTVVRVGGARRKSRLEKSLNKRSSGRRRRGSGAQVSKLNAKAATVAGLLAIGIVCGVMWFEDRRKAVRRKAAAAAAEVVAPVRERTQLERAQVPEFVSKLSQEEIKAETEKTVRGFMNATSVEERMEWVRPVEGIRERMEEYYQREGMDAQTGFGEIASSGPVAFGGIPMEVVIVKDKATQAPHPLTVLPGRDRMLIDWDSSVAYGEMSWDQFLERAPAEPTQMRVFIIKDEYYNYHFADDLRWACYRIKDRGAERAIYAYLERGSEMQAKIDFDLRSGSAVPVNLRLSFPEGMAGKGMVEIEEYLHPWWVDVASLQE